MNGYFWAASDGVYDQIGAGRFSFDYYSCCHQKKKKDCYES
jgi:hypothetical protein